MEETVKMEEKNGMKIRKIYKPQIVEQKTKQSLRVAAYCRVSTKSNEQYTSYETQVAVYTKRIKDEPGWTLAGIYADRGLSGTQADRRPQFLQMVKDCENGEIDVIICKSVSRFSRNTLDAVNYIRHLRSLGVRLIFEKENIDTDSEYSEMLLTVLAAFAQEESHSHSENVKWGKRKRVQRGDLLLIGCYGYKKSNDNYEIVPREAEAVKLIFDLYERGIPVSMITRTLNERGFPMPDGQNKAWDQSRIHYMIANEKYAGDLRTQKYYKKSFLDYRGYKNEGILPSSLIKEHHEAIIPREQFERCNKILELKKKSTPSQYPFSDLLRCPYCGHVLHHRRLEIQNIDSHYCCEGTDACRGFVIMAIPLKKAILSAYNELDLYAVKRIMSMKRRQKVLEAEKLLKEKEEHPIFQSIEYWWLDEYVEAITLGQHSYTASDLKLMGKGSALVDDRNVTVKWRCGLESTVPSGVLRDSQDPRHKAILWDGYLLRYPERFPKLTEEVKRKQGLK